MGEGKHAAKEGTMKVLIVWKVYCSQRKEVYLDLGMSIYILSDVFWMDRGPKEGGIDTVVPVEGRKCLPPFFHDVGNIPLLFTSFCICLDCY